MTNGLPHRPVYSEYAWASDLLADGAPTRPANLVTQPSGPAWAYDGMVTSSLISRLSAGVLFLSDEHGPLGAGRYRFEYYRHVRISELKRKMQFIAVAGS
jgi:hypothetical protein